MIETLQLLINYLDKFVYVLLQHFIANVKQIPKETVTIKLYFSFLSAQNVKDFNTPEIHFS